MFGVPPFCRPLRFSRSQTATERSLYINRRLPEDTKNAPLTECKKIRFRSKKFVQTLDTYVRM